MPFPSVREKPEQASSSGDPADFPRREQVPQVAAGERASHARDRFRRPFGDHLAARLPALRAEVDDVGPRSSRHRGCAR